MLTASLLTLYALSDLGVPYIYGGNDRAGMDCSAFVQRQLKLVHILPRKYDYSAQMIYNKLNGMIFSESSPGEDCILFFGKSTDKITHIAIAVNSTIMIEAGGGTSKCLSEEDAIESDAFVKFAPISKRKDLVSCIKVTY